MAGGGIDTNFYLQISTRDGMSNMMTIVNTAVWYMCGIFESY